jgi:hypothetical protein
VTRHPGSKDRPAQIRLTEAFDCERLCMRQVPGSDDEWSDERRASYGCTRIDLPIVPSKLQPKLIHFGGEMGRAPARMADKPVGVRQWNPKRPTEDPADGCPGGWYRSRFVDSVWPYLRRRDENGNRVANPLLDRCDDDLIIALVLYAEHEDERWWAHRSRVEAAP